MEDFAIVKSRTDLVQLIGESRELRRAGRNWSCLCPFHSDRKPSLDINPAKQIWRCWVCDIGGDCYDWITRSQGVSMRDALFQLADRAGVTLTGKFQPAVDRSGAYEAMAWAVKTYHSMLAKGSTPEKYLLGRAIGRSAIEKWQIGFAPDNWSFLRELAPVAKIAAGDLAKAGLVGTSAKGNQYEFFKGRIVFPIFDDQNRPVAMGGRVLPGSDDQRKYVNSPETEIFHKHRQLYGLSYARESIRKAKQAIIVEGYTDVVVAHELGLENVVACLGTALTEDHLRKLRYEADEIVLLLDGDDAGTRRATDVLGMLVGHKSKVLTLPGKLDPADFLVRNGPDKLRELIQRADDPIMFRLKQLCTGFDPRSGTGQAKEAMSQMMDLIRDCDEIDVDLAIKRMRVYFGARESVLLKMLNEKRRKASQQSQPAESASEPKVELTRRESVLLSLLIQSPDAVVDSISEQLDQIQISPIVAQVVGYYESRSLERASVEFESLLAGVEDQQARSVMVRIKDLSDKNPSANPAHDAALMLRELLPKRQRVAQDWDAALDFTERAKQVRGGAG